MSKLEPPTTLGDLQNVEKTTRKNSIFWGSWKSVFHYFLGSQKKGAQQGRDDDRRALAVLDGLEAVEELLLLRGLRGARAPSSAACVSTLRPAKVPFHTFQRRLTPFQTLKR